ncbi:hypothetical protein PCASD_08180 [Puccinia coronata f. sp. avenae]|uniref:Reverse transcriptase Ty1/copia-type domain-containing protein n=1 Tax=Puccinia coronata f. sp. avenae TaxID=200324 RepID=A0A2N5VC20_9BASI|nr:hypothetical protein PCASD_08180 [Puccinia coronata f. sp. avenae]
MADPCIFWRINVKDREDTFIFVHVDDLVIISKKPLVFKAEMEKEFKIKYMGDTVFLLGMNIERTDTSLSINQTQYIERKLAEFNLEELYPASCPLDPKNYLIKSNQREVCEFKKLGVNYWALVGALNYLSVLTRPNIAYPVSTLSQFLENPGMKHYHSAVQVFRYLSATKDIGLTFHRDNSSYGGIKSFVDANWGNCPDTRRLATGFVVLAGQHLVTWKATKQTTVSLPTTKAEYKAILDLGQELAWLANLLDEIQMKAAKETFKVFADNRGAIDLAHSEMSQNSFCTKHMAIKLHFTRELITTGLIELKYIKTTYNAADFLTKPTGRTTIRRSLQAVNLIPPSKPASTLLTRSTAGCWNDQNGAQPKRQKGLDPSPQNQARRDSALSTSNKKKSNQRNQSISSKSQLRNRITRDHTLDNIGVQTLLTRITDCP